MQFPALQAMKKYTATPLPRPREGAARPQRPPTKMGPAGPIKGDLHTFRGPQAPEQGKHVPEVGLELHSSPCKLGSRGNMQNPARSDPYTTQSEAQSVYFVHTPNCPVQRIAAPLPNPGCGCSVFCARSSPERNSGQPQHQAPSAAADRRSIIGVYYHLRKWSRKGSLLCPESPFSPIPIKAEVLRMVRGQGWFEGPS